MPPASNPALDPRKHPRQSRSQTTVTALLDAAIQVLLKVGREKLTTTRVADRAGVSVGTLYQYFPNKSALLQATLTRHLDSVMESVEAARRQHHGAALADMAANLVRAFLDAKMQSVKVSAAPYQISSDLDGRKIVRRNAVRMSVAVAAMLESAADGPLRDPQMAVFMLQSAMVGASSRLLETDSPGHSLDAVRRELTLMLQTYLAAST